MTAGPAVPPSLKAVVLACGLLVAAVTAAEVRVWPPAPKGADAPAVDFSASRALDVLHRLLDGVGARPIGSPAHALVRQRIATELERLGYTPEIQRGYACGPYGVCGPVENVMAVLKGRGEHAVLITAHYDTVGAGPGAADNASGVAAMIEMARALAASPRPRNDVVFLADDGEEAGLLGIESFLAKAPVARRVRAAVNLEARGVSGPSLLFETSSRNRWLVQQFGGVAEQPAAGSLFQLVYEKLDYDTDFSALEARGIEGYNFAFIESPDRYHTSGDVPGALSPASLQHQGDNGLAALRALAEADVERLPAGKAVFFDVMGMAIVSWPETATLYVASVPLVATGLAVWLYRRRGALALRRVALALIAFPVAMLSSAVLGFGLLQVFRSLNVETSAWAVASFMALGVTIAGAVSVVLLRNVGRADFLVAQSAWWVLTAIVLAGMQPAASYPVLVPAVAWAVTALAATWRDDRVWSHVLLAAPAVVIAILWVPVIHHLYAGLAGTALPAVGVAACVIALAMGAFACGLSLRGRSLAVVGSFALVGVVAVLAAIATDAPVNPQMTLTLHHDEHANRARWLLRTNRPASSARLASMTPIEPFPWSGPWERVFVFETPAVDLPAPIVSILDDSQSAGIRTVRVNLRSPRGAPTLTLRLPGDVAVVSAVVNEAPVPLVTAEDLGWFGGWWTFTSLATPAPGVEMVLRWTTPGTVTALVLDQGPGWPAGVSGLRDIRPPHALSAHDGDASIVSTTYAF
ncbi:MAG: M28 family peptidase [Vicinamibacterales bacterium]